MGSGGLPDETVKWMATTKTSQLSLNKLLKTERVSLFRSATNRLLSNVIVPRHEVLLQNGKTVVQEDSRGYGGIWRA